jgi:hypothetical protein
MTAALNAGTTDGSSVATSHLTATVAGVAAVAGVAWVALGIESVVRPEVMHYRDALVLVPLLLYAVTVGGIQALQRHRSGRLGKWSAAIVIGAISLVVAANVAMLLGVEGAQQAAFPLGPLGWIVGMVAFGVATARAGVLTRRDGWLLALSQPLTMVTSLVLSPIAPLAERGTFSGTIAHGVVMLLLATSLRRVARSDQQR